jgi:hypothetical protein
MDGSMMGGGGAGVGHSAGEVILGPGGPQHVGGVMGLQMRPGMGVQGQHNSHGQGVMVVGGGGNGDMSGPGGGHGQGQGGEMDGQDPLSKFVDTL